MVLFLIKPNCYVLYEENTKHVLSTVNILMAE